MRTGGSFVERARRDQIVRATIEVLAERGYAASSFKQIAAHVEVSPALITYHFRTRDLLMRSVLETVEARLDAAMAGDGAEPDSYPGALRGMLERYVGHCSEHGDEISAMTEIRRHARGEGVRATVAGNHAGGTAELVAFVEEGQAHGQFRGTDPALFATVLMSAMGEVPRLLTGDRASDRALAAEWAGLFVAALSATGEPTEEQG
ncbi:TetR/AcrR family transcriptional regulator [Pseudonocardia sp. HH130630-07]|uniref:TetR/AcrR family transcriptional regulator n=1 Tax=Pseudonocardia sp. HH130630-07 TaxID=1690815 RepID=UPI0008153A52|nr:TetR/AcrR family transcriptional regulator [Pseudonocardia sp. HH130630-07]ANY06345.1 hypothetical protein AFB00_08620 [Pseudonocardia sp. HH130630-07]